MPKIETSAFIDIHGVLQIHDREKFSRALKGQPNTPGTITFEPIKNKITHAQRKYFYGVIVEILQAFFITTGDDEVKKIDVMDLLKDRFLFREKMCPITHKYMKVPISLSDNEGSMTRAEFTEKKEAIQKWAMETLELELPEPDPNWRMYKKNDDGTKR